MFSKNYFLGSRAYKYFKVFIGTTIGYLKVMNIISYQSNQKSKIVFIIVDRTNDYKNGWTAELIKNISDYTISNIWAKKYDIIVGLDENELLRASVDDYDHAVVISTGTEFINGHDFFKAVEKLTKENYFIAGHVLDRKDAYFELHHQCYILNLKKYKYFNCPEIGDQALGSQHQQFSPVRSSDNYHDDYTPISVSKGTHLTKYNHKCHGWHILSIAFKHNEKIVVFDNEFRNSKKYYYPENQKDFLNHIQWAYSRERYCLNEFIHTDHTEQLIINDYDFECVITPASGTWFIPCISKDKPVTVIYYDYNQKSLDYWKEHAPEISNVHYKFVKIDLLGMCNYNEILPKNNVKTIINLSNIFCYEGTSMFSSLSYRNSKESELLNLIPDHFFVMFSARSCQGFYTADHYGQGLLPTKITQFIKPTWHMNYDWAVGK